jgi:hypothetical protein
VMMLRRRDMEFLPGGRPMRAAGVPQSLHPAAQELKKCAEVLR